MNTSKKLPDNVAAVILAAGFSGRMGRPKWSLPFDSHVTFIEKIVAVFLNAGCKKIILVMNNSGERQIGNLPLIQPSKQIQIVLNRYPQKGRFYSVQQGLAAATTCRAVFLHNVDNPFVTSDLLVKMNDVFNPDTIVVPRFKGKGGHPVLLSADIVKSVVNSFSEKENLRDVLGRFLQKTCKVQNDMILRNINTPEEYRFFFGKDVPAE